MCKNISKKSKIEGGVAFWNFKSEWTDNAIPKSPTDGHSLKSASPYEKTNSPAPLASLTDYLFIHSFVALLFPSFFLQKIVKLFKREILLCYKICQ